MKKQTKRAKQPARGRKATKVAKPAAKKKPTRKAVRSARPQRTSVRANAVERDPRQPTLPGVPEPIEAPQAAAPAMRRVRTRTLVEGLKTTIRLDAQTVARIEALKPHLFGIAGAGDFTTALRTVIVHGLERLEADVKHG